MDYLVVYASKTGNTQKVAMNIFGALPGNSKDIQNIEEWTGVQADTYFVGFWNDRGTCGREIMDFLSELHGKRVALFGTCGMGGSKEYFDQVAARVAVFLPDDCRYLGHFLCAGKMPPQVLERYKEICSVQDSKKARTMISICEQAMLHPDAADYRAAREFALQVIK